MNKILHRVESLICTPKTDNDLRSHLKAIMALDHRRLIRPEKKIRTIVLRSTSLLCVILPTNLGTCKPTLYTIYTSHLRWNSTMRHCFYHTDLGQNAVFHNLTLEYKLHSFNIQDDRSMHALLAKRLKKISKTTYTASRFPLLPVRDVVECLNEH